MKVFQGFSLVSLLVCSGTALSQDDDLVGDWTIVTSGFSFVGNTTSYVHLTIEDQDGELEAYIYNGPVPIRVAGNRFEIDLDWSSGFDEKYLSTFRGEIDDAGEMQGKLTHNGAKNFLGRAWNDGAFTGERAAVPASLDGLQAKPIDMSGVYGRASGLGAVRKIDFSMTERGQGIIDDYLEVDNANSRCASPGLVLASGLPYPMEILHADNYIVIVYGADYARRIYLDGREFPEFGFSVGEWRGETLIVTTTKLNPAFMSTRGQPVSDDAYTIEHFFFDDKGYLHADMWLHDPANYARPPQLRRVYDQNFALSVITKVDCDPYSFFRALALEGELEAFWARSAKRR